MNLVVSGALTSTTGQLDDADTQRLVLAPTLSTKNETASSAATREEWYQTSAKHLGLVRRLTPVECERLMSWPDDWTAVDNEDTPDSRRYAACGDGVVSNVAEWIARGIVREDAA